MGQKGEKPQTAKPLARINSRQPPHDNNAHDRAHKLSYKKMEFPIMIQHHCGVS